MPRKVEPREKIVIKSIGFPFRQHEFFNANPDFKPDACLREEIDKQIKYKKQYKFLSKKKEEKNEETTNE